MTDAVWIAIAVSFAANALGWLLYPRTVEQRFDAQSERLAKVELKLGLRVEFPYDIECPMCGSARGVECRDARGDVRSTAHHSRYLDDSKNPRKAPE